MSMHLATDAPATRHHTGVSLADTIAAGLPVSALDRLVRALAPQDDTLRYAFVPRPTLARRIQQKRLSPEESARVERVGRVFAMAREAWGDAAEARAFMRRQHPMLEDRTPLDIALATDVGARVVEEILGRLIHGTAA
jgi:putative toxin-antitoxin system antitoxin component (TIGR02293 family)